MAILTMMERRTFQDNSSAKVKRHGGPMNVCITVVTHEITRLRGTIHLAKKTTEKHGTASQSKTYYYLSRPMQKVLPAAHLSTLGVRILKLAAEFVF